MFAGHFGLAAAVKAKTPELPLWSLMIGSQLLDIVFMPLSIAGIESMDERHGTGYGDLIIHAYYTHSLVGALLLALLGGVLTWLWKGNRAGMVMGAVIFSHWLLDLIVHRPDMPIFPGNAGDLPLLGLSLWTNIGWSIVLESLLLVIGFVMYARSSLQETAGRTQTTRQVLIITFVGVLFALLLTFDVMS